MRSLAKLVVCGVLVIGLSASLASAKERQTSPSGCPAGTRLVVKETTICGKVGVDVKLPGVNITGGVQRCTKVPQPVCTPIKGSQFNKGRGR